MRRVFTFLSVLSLVIVGSASAQGDEVSLAELRRQAERLERLALVPAEARSNAEALLARIETFRSEAEALERSRLLAYIEALEAGHAVAVAREMALQAVADERLALVEAREELERDLRGFIADHPEAARLFARLPHAAAMRFKGEAGPRTQVVRPLARHWASQRRAAPWHPFALPRP